MKRRHFLAAAASTVVPTAIAQVNPMTGGGVKPITDEERRGRIEKARRLMRDQKIGAIVLESGSSMFYFTGVRWGLSERLFSLVLPAKGELAFAVPAFEEERARQLIRFTNDVRVWQEDESPFALVAQILKDRGVAAGRAGFEENVRFFVSDGIRKEAPAIEYVSATPVTAGCRMFKSAAELALLKRANEITLEAIKESAATLKEGMTPAQLNANLRAAYASRGVTGGGLIAFGAASAFPHGSTTPQKLKEGEIVLVDTGCTLDGYTSDITRTWVLGKSTARQRQIFDLERKAQDAAFAAAQVGATCESVDAAARKVITDAGFGPGYKVPGLPHRTGHGIGLDGHEWTNFVKGNKTKLAPGMCFSDEPMIAIYGEFGVRLEDCLCITEDGPRMFTRQSGSIDDPFGGA